MKTHKLNVLVNVLFTFLLLLAGCRSQKPLGTDPIPSSVSHSTSIGDGEQILDVPCLKESYDADDDLRGLGIAEKADMDEAKTLAEVKAKAALYNKYCGSFKVGLRRYLKDTHDAADKKESIFDLEHGIEEIAQSAINAYAKQYCLSFTKTKLGMFKAYYVCRIPTEQINQKVEKELARRNVEYNKKEFFDFLDKSLKEQENKAIQNTPSGIDK